MKTNKPIRILADEFTLYKRSIGYVYKTQELFLMNYVGCAESVSPGICIPDKKTVSIFLKTLSDSSGSLYNTTAVIREFGKYLLQRGYNDAYIIPPKNSPALDPDPPYFFTADEISRFFNACDTIETHLSYPGRELVFPALFRLLYCCGLRCKEARTLLYESVHLDDCFFDVLQSKGSKNRRVYINDELSKHLRVYDESINNLFPNRKYFFPHKADTCYEAGAISGNFRRFWRIAFPEFVRASRPRAYDLRHHFVWANLNRWAKEGLDVNVMLPYLSRFIGHQSITSTLYYFRFVPDFFPVFANMANPLESVLPEVPSEG